MRHAVIATILFLTGTLHAQPPVRRTVAPTGELATLTLVRSSATEAVVRFGSSAVELVAVGDVLGKSAATVTEIAAGRLVLEEVTKSADGTPLRTRIVLKEGETGGRRYQRQPGVTPTPGVRPDVLIAPDGKKKPGAPKRGGGGQ